MKNVYRYPIRNGRTEALAASNPVLARGELCLDTVEHSIKCGDGIHHWSELQAHFLPTKDVNGEYISIERLREYLYRVTFDTLPESNGGDEPYVGSCSSYVSEGKLHRNFDYPYDNLATFILRTRGFEAISVVPGLNDSSLDNNKIAQLPYRLVDGRNNNGIMVSVHLLFNDWQWAGVGDKSIPLTRLPYEILSRVKSMDSISADLDGVLGNLAYVDALGDYLLQVLVTDGTTTYAVIPPLESNQAYVLVDATSNPKMTNFRWVADSQVVRASLQLRPTGVERFNAMPCDLEVLRFTKAYEAANRLSEFIGIDGTTKASTDEELTAIYDEAREEYLGRQRDGKTWHTMHSVVYGGKMLELYIQENWKDDIVSDANVDFGQYAKKDGYYQTLSAGYADKAGDLDIQTSAMVRHTQTKAMETTGGDKDVKDGAGFVRVVKGTEDGITAAGAKIISLGFNLIPSGNGTSFTFRCVKGEWGAYGTSAKNNGYLFTDSQGNILVPTSVKQNGVDVPTHTDHGNTYYLPSQDGQCTVVFAASQNNPCAHLCWSNGRDTKDNYEAYNASQVDLSSAINAIGGTLRRVGYVFDEVNLETKQSTRRLGKILLNALTWTMEAGPEPEEGEATNTFRAIVSGGVASGDTIKAGGAFAVKGLSGMTFSLDGTSLVCDSTIASVEDFVTALGSGTVEYELAVEVVASNSLNGQITISDYGIIIFENTAGASVVDIDFDFDTKWRDFIKNLPDDLSTKDRVIAEALCNLDKRLAGIEAMIDGGFPSLKVDDLTIARALFTRIALGDAFVAKAGAPAGIPAGVLQFYRNTTDGSIYLSVGSESTSDWIKIK